MPIIFYSNMITEWSRVKESGHRKAYIAEILIFRWSAENWTIYTRSFLLFDLNLYILRGIILAGYLIEVPGSFLPCSFIRKLEIKGHRRPLSFRESSRAGISKLRGILMTFTTFRSSGTSRVIRITLPGI